MLYKDLGHPAPGKHRADWPSVGAIPGVCHKRDEHNHTLVLPITRDSMYMFWTGVTILYTCMDPKQRKLMTGEHLAGMLGVRISPDT